MAASYPSAIKTFTTKTDGVDDVLASHINDPQLEITAIETELGTTPKASYASVDARLDAIQTVVAARYTTNSGATMTNNTPMRINFEDLGYDTHSAVTTGAGAWKFTAPVAGYYHVSFHMTLDSSTGWSAGEQLEVLSDGTAGTLVVSYSENHNTGGGSVRMVARGDFDCSLAAGGTVWITLRQASGADVNLLSNGNYNWICIHKILGT